MGSSGQGLPYVPPLGKMKNSDLFNPSEWPAGES